MFVTSMYNDCNKHLFKFLISLHFKRISDVQNMYLHIQCEVNTLFGFLLDSYWRKLHRDFKNKLHVILKK